MKTKAPRKPKPLTLNTILAKMAGHNGEVYNNTLKAGIKRVKLHLYADNEEACNHQGEEVCAILARRWKIKATFAAVKHWSGAYSLTFYVSPPAGFNPATVKTVSLTAYAKARDTLERLKDRVNTLSHQADVLLGRISDNLTNSFVYTSVKKPVRMQRAFNASLALTEKLRSLQSAQDLVDDSELLLKSFFNKA